MINKIGYSKNEDEKKTNASKKIETQKKKNVQPNKNTRNKNAEAVHMQTTTPDKQNRKTNFQSISSTMMTQTKNNGKINAFLCLILGKRALTYSNRNAACRFNLPRLAGRSYFFYPHVANSQAQRLIVSRPNIQVTDDDKAVHEPIKKWNKNIWHKTKLNSIRKIKRHGADREKNQKKTKSKR